MPGRCRSSASAVSATPAVRSPDASASSRSARELGTTSVATAVVAIGPGTIAAAASSTIAHRSSTVPPAPPDSSGRATPKMPSWARPAYGARHAAGSPCSMSRAASTALDPAAQLRTSSRAANCSSVPVADACDISGLLCLRARRACFSLERVLMVPAFERQVDRHYSRTRRCRRRHRGEKLGIGMRIVFTEIA